MKPRQSAANDRPRPLAGILRISRQEAARGQIDSAILLWFYERDTASVHTLTVAAQGVLTALCRDMKQPLSKVVTWIDAQPKKFQEQIRNPQNFFKHGHHKQRYKDVSSYSPELAETFLIDNVAVYQDLFGNLTPSMFVFALRFSISHPRGLPLIAFKFTDERVAEVLKVDKLAGLSREAFFERVLPLVIKRVGTHLESP